MSRKETNADKRSSQALIKRSDTDLGLGCSGRAPEAELSSLFLSPHPHLPYHSMSLLPSFFFCYFYCYFSFVLMFSFSSPPPTPPSFFSVLFSLHPFPFFPPPFPLLPLSSRPLPPPLDHEPGGSREGPLPLLTLQLGLAISKPPFSEIRQ